MSQPSRTRDCLPPAASRRRGGTPGWLAHGGRVLTALLLCLAAGCKSIGPGTVTRDRMHYSTAVAESWKEQLLLNIVNSRYGDAPSFLEVVSVVSGYSLETGVSLDGQFSPANLRGDTFAAGGVSGRYTDRPTISYAPLTGEKFARSLLAPAPLDSLLFVIEGGAPADFMLALTLHALEGHHNVDAEGFGLRPADPQFLRAVRLVGDLQRARAIEFEVSKSGATTSMGLRFHPPKTAGGAAAEQMDELKSLLGLPAGQTHARLAFGLVADEPEVVAMRSRSLMQILHNLSAGVQVPEEHLKDGSARALDGTSLPVPFTVRSGKERPDESFAAVPCQGYWFWVDRRDLTTKSTLSAVTLMFNFLESGGDKASPVLTIPTQ